MSQSVTGGGGFAVQMLQIETIEGPGVSNHHKGAPFVVVALATAFPQIKPAKINLSLIGRF